MGGWSLGNFSVIVELGHNDDSDIDLVVKTQNIPVGSVTVKEGSNAEEVLYWPGISMTNPDRRAAIFNTALGALERADGMKAQKVGFFTMGLEVSRIPSWEVAEEIVKAIANHSKTESSLNRILLIASSPMQVSSFQYALNNVSILTQE
ncbi:MAG: hypothetical protein KGD60_01085 [Candidatus Thorarchaeota archaeon]|nr:hypothetical protein [Candidatus Thorarchaeota archaeon]